MRPRSPTFEDAGDPPRTPPQDAIAYIEAILAEGDPASAAPPQGPDRHHPVIRYPLGAFRKGRAERPYPISEALWAELERSAAFWTALCVRREDVRALSVLAASPPTLRALRDWSVDVPSLPAVLTAYAQLLLVLGVAGGSVLITPVWCLFCLWAGDGCGMLCVGLSGIVLAGSAGGRALNLLTTPAFRTRLAWWEAVKARQHAATCRAFTPDRSDVLAFIASEPALIRRHLCDEIDALDTEIALRHDVIANIDAACRAVTALDRRIRLQDLRAGQETHIQKLEALREECTVLLEEEHAISDTDAYTNKLAAFSPELHAYVLAFREVNALERP